MTQKENEKKNIYCSFNESLDTLQPPIAKISDNDKKKVKEKVKRKENPFKLQPTELMSPWSIRMTHGDPNSIHMMTAGGNY